jgi:uncharacterized membrane protein
MRVSAVRLSLLLAALICIGAVVLAESSRHLPCTVLRGADMLTVPLSGLSPGSVRAFCYSDETGRKLRFLLARESNGTVHGVFDACQRCYRFHKGYDWSNGYLVCRVCGTRYRVKDITVGKASCVPVPIKIRTGDRVTINVADVKAGKWLF